MTTSPLDSLLFQVGVAVLGFLWFIPTLLTGFAKSVNTFEVTLWGYALAVIVFEAMMGYSISLMGPVADFSDKLLYGIIIVAMAGIPILNWYVLWLWRAWALWNIHERERALAIHRRVNRGLTDKLD